MKMAMSGPVMNRRDRFVVCSRGPCPSEQPEPKKEAALRRDPNLSKLPVSGRHRLSRRTSGLFRGCPVRGSGRDVPLWHLADIAADAEQREKAGPFF